jgi:PqqD family protein of HPr-rel-A system
MATRSTRWSTQPLLWKQWLDELVVYNLTSGNTHVINPIAAKILRQLELQPSTPTQLAENVASEFDLESDQEVVGHVERLIGDFDELGLVKPIPD